MANKIGANPIVIDSVMAAPFKSGVHVSSAIWSAPAAIGHQLTIVDRNGNIIFTGQAQAANENVDISVLDVWWQNGFQVTAIDSGTLLIYM